MSDPCRDAFEKYNESTKMEHIPSPFWHCWKTAWESSRWIPSIEDLEFVIDGATFEGMKPELAHHYAKCVHAYLEKHIGGPE